MIASDAASFAVRTAMGVLLVTGHAQVWELIALQACRRRRGRVLLTRRSYGLVREVVRPELLQQANSYLAIARYAAFPLGAAAGGTIVATVGSGTALLFDAGTYADERAAPLAGARRVDRARGPELRARAARRLERVRRAHVGLGALLWIALYFLITYAPFFVLGPYIAKHSMGGAGSWGAVVTGEGIGALLGSLAGLRFRPRRPLVATGAALPADRSPERPARLPRTRRALAPAAALAGFAFACGSVVWDTRVQRTIAPEKLARVAAYGWMGAMVFLPAGYALAGPIASRRRHARVPPLRRRLARREHARDRAAARVREFSYAAEPAESRRVAATGSSSRARAARPRTPRAAPSTSASDDASTRTVSPSSSAARRGACPRESCSATPRRAGAPPRRPREVEVGILVARRTLVLAALLQRRAFDAGREIGQRFAEHLDTTGPMRP